MKQSSAEQWASETYIGVAAFEIQFAATSDGVLNRVRTQLLALASLPVARQATCDAQHSTVVSRGTVGSWLDTCF